MENVEEVELTGLSIDIILVQHAQYSPLPLRLVDYLVPSQCDEGPSEMEKIFSKRI